MFASLTYKLTYISNQVYSCEDREIIRVHQKFQFHDHRPPTVKFSNQQFRIDVQLK